MSFKNRFSTYKNYNVINLVPSIQVFYERRRIDSKKFYYLMLDFVWLNRGLSINLLKTKNNQYV
jgi:hypothetical protein